MSDFEFCWARYDYKKEYDGELELVQGETIKIIYKHDEQWFYGEGSNGVGMFPAAWVYTADEMASIEGSSSFKPVYCIPDNLVGERVADDVKAMMSSDRPTEESFVKGLKCLRMVLVGSLHSPRTSSKKKKKEVQRELDVVNSQLSHYGHGDLQATKTIEIDPNGELGRLIKSTTPRRRTLGSNFKSLIGSAKKTVRRLSGNVDVSEESSFGLSASPNQAPVAASAKPLPPPPPSVSASSSPSPLRRSAVVSTKKSGPPPRHDPATAKIMTCNGLVAVQKSASSSTPIVSSTISTTSTSTAASFKKPAEEVVKPPPTLSSIPKSSASSTPPSSPVVNNLKVPPQFKAPLPDGKCCETCLKNGKRVKAKRVVKMKSGTETKLCEDCASSSSAPSDPSKLCEECKVRKAKKMIVLKSGSQKKFCDECYEKTLTGPSEKATSSSTEISVSSATRGGNIWRGRGRGAATSPSRGRGAPAAVGSSPKGPPRKWPPVQSPSALK